MSNFMGRMEEKFQKRVAEVAKETGKDRFDVVFWDHQITGPREARVLLGFNPSLGIPKRPDVAQFIIAEFHGRLRTMLDTIELHPDNLITATVLKIPQVLPEEVSHDMIRVGATSWQDQKESIWELMETKEGKKYLTRVEAEDLDQLLKFRKKENKTATYHMRPRLANLETIGVSTIDVGDRVSFTHRGSVLEGEVLRIDGDKVLISAEDKNLEVMKPSIMNVTDVSEADKKKSKEELIRFFTEAYGDKGFATKLVTL